MIKVLTELRAKHSKPEGAHWGIDGRTGKVSDMKELDVWDPVSVKIQTFKTAIEACCMLLRIDDIVSGIRSSKQPGESQKHDDDDDETFGDERDG